MAPLEKDPTAGLNAAVAAAFRAERGALGMTFDELSEKSGVPVRSLMRFLNAQRHMDVAVVDAISEGLGMTPLEVIENAQRRLAKAVAELPQILPVNQTDQGAVDVFPKSPSLGNLKMVRSDD